jgi:histidinol dehydrogenase
MKLKILNGDKRNFIQELTKFLNVRRNTQSKNLFMVKRIVNDVRSNGDKAIFKYEKKFTKTKKLNKKFALSDGEVLKIIKKLNKETKKSIDIAFNRIEKFHKKQLFKSFKFRDKYQNEMSYRYTPIESVGVYVPGGRANYPSSVLMNCIPAKVAGVKKIFMTTPLNKTIPNPAVIYAAKKCGVKKIYKIGGAQAVAALAFGTKKIEKVNKIVGPGNSYVAGAKKEVFGEVGIDMIAGPSEVLIVSDKYSNPDWVASDLIAQAEHDEFSQSILVSSNRNLIAKVNKSLSFQLTSLPKKKIAITSLRNFGLAIYSKKISRIIEIINEVAPEHLEIQLKDGEKILNKIKNAGSIFLGKYSPEAMGDYLAGPNHVLPTTGTAKFSSGLSVFDFLKRQSLIKITKRGIERLGPSVINLALYENLDGHAISIKKRL